MATIHEVAREAGVSSATVSRVLTGSAQVRAETKARVMAAVERLGYRPNLVGRNLRKQETHMILVFLGTIVNSFFAKVIKGMEDVAEKNGYHILICTTYGERERELSYLGMLVNRLVDGALFLTTALTAEDINRLGESYPIVQCNEYVEGARVPFVSIDNELAGYAATRHLIQSGRRAIVHMTADAASSTSAARLHGYRRALADSGIPFDPALVLTGNYGYRNASRIMSAFLETGRQVDGLFAVSDRMAAGAAAACRLAGRRVPEDVAVVGFDNVDISYMVEPAITTISQSQYEMGATGMGLLLDRIAGRPVPQSVTIPHKLIVRQSAP